MVIMMQIDARGHSITLGNPCIELIVKQAHEQGQGHVPWLLPTAARAWLCLAHGTRGSQGDFVVVPQGGVLYAQLDWEQQHHCIDSEQHPARGMQLRM